MSYKRPSIRDGSGPYKDSYRRRVEGKTTGRRRAAGVKCPKKK